MPARGFRDLARRACGAMRLPTSARSRQSAYPDEAVLFGRKAAPLLVEEGRELASNACAEGALECGGLTPPFPDAYVLGSPWRSQGGVKPPHSKALRAFHGFWVSVRRRTWMTALNIQTAVLNDRLKHLFKKSEPESGNILRTQNSGNEAKKSLKTNEVAKTKRAKRTQICTRKAANEAKNAAFRDDSGSVEVFGRSRERVRARRGR